MVFKITEGGGKTLPLVKGVLVDTENPRALKTQPFPGLARSKFPVDALHGGAPQLHKTRQRRGANAFMVLDVDLLAPGFGAALPGPQSGRLGKETATTSPTLKAPGLDLKKARQAKGI